MTGTCSLTVMIRTAAKTKAVNNGPEIQHDEIDHICNGYDLTIQFSKPSYLANRDILSVEAVSIL